MKKKQHKNDCSIINIRKQMTNREAKRLNFWTNSDFRFQYLLIIFAISHRIKIIKFLEPRDSESDRRGELPARIYFRCMPAMQSEKSKCIIEWSPARRSGPPPMSSTRHSHATAKTKRQKRIYIFRILILRAHKENSRLQAKERKWNQRQINPAG